MYSYLCNDCQTYHSQYYLKRLQFKRSNTCNDLRICPWRTLSGVLIIPPHLLTLPSSRLWHHLLKYNEEHIRYRSLVAICRPLLKTWEIFHFCNWKFVTVLQLKPWHLYLPWLSSKWHLEVKITQSDSPFRTKWQKWRALFKGIRGNSDENHFTHLVFTEVVNCIWDVYCVCIKLDIPGVIDDTKWHFLRNRA